MTLWLKQSTDVELAVGPFLDSTDGITPETGLTITEAEVFLKKNAGDWADKSEATSLVHESNGWYRCLLNTTDTNTNGVLMLAITESGAMPVWHQYMVVPANVWDSLFGSDLLDVNVAQWLGTAAATPTTAGVPEVDITHIAGAAVSTTTAQLGVNVVQISTDATAADNLEAYFDGTVGGYGGQAAYGSARIWIDTGAGAAGTTNYVHGTMTNPNSSMANSRTLANALDITAFHVANGSTVTLDQGYNNFTFYGEEWNLALASRAIGNSRFEGAVVSGLSTGSGVTFSDCHMGTCTIDPCHIEKSELSASAIITIGTAGTFTMNHCHSETPSGSEPTIDFGAAVGASTVSNARFSGAVIIANLKAGDVYAQTGWGRVTLAASCTAGEVRLAGNINLVNNGSGLTISDTSRYNEDQNVTNVTGNVNGNVVGSVGSVAAGGITAASIATDAIDDDAIATGAIASTAFASGAINAAALATDAVAEIADGVWDEAIAGHLGVGSTGAALNGATAPSAAIVADAVWDEAIVGHLGAGSTGAALNAAGAAGDPWSTPIPGAYGGGTAGNLVGTNLDATVTSRASQASVDALPTAASIWAHILEGALSAEAMMRIFLAALAGKLSGASGISPFTIRFRDRADTVDRIVATTDVDGNRTNVTVDGS